MTFEQALAQSKTTGNWESDFALGWQARDEEVKAMTADITQCRDEFRQALSTRDSEISRLYEEVHSLQARIERVRALLSKWEALVTTCNCVECHQIRLCAKEVMAALEEKE